MCCQMRGHHRVIVALCFLSIRILAAPQIGFQKRVMTQGEFNHFKAHTGIYEPGRNYNKLINGHGTGLRPPTIQVLNHLRTAPILLDGAQYIQRLGKRSAPTQHDNSETSWFPPIGSQGSEGSCVSWATGYYTKTFQEAREHGWDLSGASWSAAPDASHQHQIFSPDFIYHQVNGGVDEGSYYSDNINLLHRIGCCTWDQMPYDDDDSVTWPLEAAWRQAPLYRSASGFAAMFINNVAALDVLKQFLADGNLGVISINADLYDVLTDQDLWTYELYNPDGTNHANTIVGYDDDYGPYNEDGNANTYGAFKVANSWGVGGWENVDDGFIFISYQCLLERIQYVYFYENVVAYEPTVLAVFSLTHAQRGACRTDVGIWNGAAPLVSKPLDDFHYNGGAHPYPAHAMALDITEFSPQITSASQLFYLDVADDGSAAGGSIDQFSLEKYTDYGSGVPAEVYVSTDPVVAIPSGATGRATLISGTNSIYAYPQAIQMAQTAGDADITVLCTGTAPMDWTAAVSSGASWLSTASGSTGSGSGTVQIHCTENTVVESRTGSVVFTADWADNSPYTVSVTQAGTLTGLWVQVHLLDGSAAEGAVVEVYSSRSNSHDYSTYTNASGEAHLPQIPNGTYDVLVYSYYDHFAFVLPNMELPGSAALEVSTLTPVTINTLARDGVSPISTEVTFTPWYGAHGYCGSTASATGTGIFYVSDWMYTGVASVCFSAPHHLVFLDQHISGPCSFTFNPVSMPTGAVHVHLESFEDVALHHWMGYSRWSWGVPVADGEQMIFSEGVYSNLDPELRLGDGSGNTWRFDISQDGTPYRNVNITAGSTLDLHAGGAFEVDVLPQSSNYASGATVSTDLLIHDQHSNRIDDVYGYIPDSAPQAVAVRSRGQRIVSLPENIKTADLCDAGVKDGGYQSVVPQIVVSGPSSSTIASHAGTDLFWDYNFTLPNPAEEGAYRISLELETGPHQGIVSGDATFYVGVAPAPVTQAVALAPAKLNLISFNVQPTAIDIEDMLDDVETLLVAQDDEGNFCIPPYFVNAIGDVDFSNGYQVYYTDANPESAVNEGMPLDPTAITQALTNTKLFMIGNPYQTAQTVETVFAAIADKIVVVQDDAGLFWIPAYGVNSIGHMQPGKGYQIFVDEAVSFTYPAEAASGGGQMAKARVNPSRVRPRHFNFTETGQSYAIVLTGSELSLSAGDEMGVYDGDCCVGAAVFDGSYPLVIPAWQAVSQQDLALPGYAPGNPVSLKVHRAGDRAPQSVTVDFQENGCFGQGGMTVLHIENIDQSQAVPTAFRLQQNYPNPFNPETRIQVDLPEAAQVTAVVFNVRGQVVRTLMDDQRTPGRYTLLWDGRDESGGKVASGLYILSLHAGAVHKRIKMIYSR